MRWIGSRSPGWGTAGRNVCDSGHMPSYRSRCGPGPPRLPAGGARALPVPHARRGGGDGGPGAARPGRRARPPSRASSWSPTSSSASTRRRRTSRAAGSSCATRSTRSGRPRGPALPRRRRLDRRLHRLPAAGGRGARVALDVAYGELDWSLREDPRVTVIERVNARALEPSQLPYAPDLIVVDVSLHLAAQGAPGGAGLRGASASTRWRWSSRSSRSGARARRAAAAWCATRRRGGPRSTRWPRARSSSGCGCSASPPRACPGPAGNLETFAWLAEGGRAGRVDVEAALAEVDA